MGNLLWIILGFCGGAIVSQNSKEMADPEKTAIFLCMVVGCGIVWTMGYRGKSVAIATAVATAVAQANAQAEASARAAASSAINLYLGAQAAGIAPEHVGSIIDHSVQEIASQRVSSDTVMSQEKETA